MSAREFSVGEWVERKMDGKVGVVKKVSEYDGDFLFYVNFPEDREPDETWAGTTAAWRRRFRTHAHVDSSSRDCDGDYTSGRVEEMTLLERCDQFGDLHFKERILGNAVSLHGHGTATVTPDGFHWHEVTDEGFRASEVEWCEDECSAVRPWQRDHRAESMGY